jgi:hypothetical protein
MRLLIEFDDYKEEQALIGRMLMAYGEFEFSLAGLMAYAFGYTGEESGERADQGARIFFRVNGEAARLDVADAILRPYMATLGLPGQWGNCLGALRYCKDIRNQYAHCNWLKKPEGLFFLNMDRDAGSSDGILILQLYPTDLTLLKKQHEYFEYAEDWLFFLRCRCQKVAGREALDPPTPKSIPQPPTSNRPKKPPPAH